MDTPIEKFSEDAYDVLMYGSGNEIYEITRYFGGVERQQKTSFEVPFV